nr:hypothetical protein [Tanacetum cinerariifolium]
EEFRQVRRDHDDTRRRLRRLESLVERQLGFRHLGISEGVGAHTEDGIDLGVEVATSDIREDKDEFEVEASAGGTMAIDSDNESKYEPEEISDEESEDELEEDESEVKSGEE